MDDHRADADVEYDSEDMSAGARLMRYYVSDESRPDLAVQTSKRSTTNKSRQDLEGHDLMSSDAARASNANSSSPLHNSHTLEQSDDAAIAHDVEELRGDLLYDIAGRHSHRDLLAKVQESHPHAGFNSKELTTRLYQAVKSRASRLGLTQEEVRDELDEMREANGVASTKQYRVRNRKKRKGQGGESGVGVGTSQSNEEGQSSEIEGDDHSRVSSEGQRQGVRRSSRRVTPVATNGATLAELDSFLKHA